MLLAALLLIEVWYWLCTPFHSFLLQWDDETDMVKLEECVRSVAVDGLLWGTSKLVPVGYGIKKLQIACVVEDDKVGTDILEEEITKFEDYVSTWRLFKCFHEGQTHRPVRGRKE